MKMPNSLTSSFASAAAGANSDNSHRRDGPGANDWPRPRMNGTTFRRPSTQSRDNLNAASVSTTGVYIPPHLNQQGSSSRNGTLSEARYSREELLSIYTAQKEAGLVGNNINSLFAGPWDLHSAADGRSEAKDSGPEVCWNSSPTTVPLGLKEMDENEKQLFSTSVNSPLKINNPKDASSMTPGGRKTSVSGGNSTGVPRPGTRRRETSDSFGGNGPLSPAEPKTFRNEPNTSTPPPALLRRRTDYQDDAQEKEEMPTTRPGDVPVNSLRRVGTGGPPSAGLNAPSASPWSSGPSAGFGAFSAAAGDTGAGESAGPPRPGFGSTRSTSRFKDILAKTGEDLSPSVKEKESFGALEKLPEEEDQSSKLRETLKTRPNRSETNPYDGVMPRSGSAALSAHDEPGIEQMGFSAFSASQTPHHRLTQDPASPTSTNPYQSPPGGRMHEDEGSEPQQGLPAPFGRRDMFAGGEHRPQNSFGSIRGPSSSLSGFGGFPGWDNPGFGTGTPGRERPAVSMASAFGDPVFGPLGGLQSPGAFGGNNNVFGGTGSFGRGGSQSRLGLPFPPAMQDQMRSDSRNDGFGPRPDPFEPRRQDSIRGAFDEMRPGPGDDAFGQFPANRSPAAAVKRSGSNSPAGSGGDPTSQIPEAQQRQMVMPDRMLWVYRDPSGVIQGPFTGLEMHDWFKAGFFTAELQIKKVEDRDYEPLAQLIRRIGNSREPFLVPQIGIPHGPPKGQPSNTLFGSSGGGGGGSSAQPPFPSAFPNFGTTLTADQQNALERRKQEEQTLMAQQKEWLAQNKLGIGRPGSMQYPGQMHSLQHHSSAHSLHSQPSFGSITSPAGYQPSPLQGPIQPPPQAHAFQSMASTSAPAQREEGLPAQFNRLGIDTRGPYSTNPLNQQSFAAHERNRLSMENQQAQQLAHENTFFRARGRNERLEEFHELRKDMDDEELDLDSFPQPIGSQRPTEEVLATQKQPPGPIGPSAKKSMEESEPLSLAQQVQRTAAANKQAAEGSGHVEPPPQSISPLPAPAAQRSRPPVAEQLAAESRSTTQTPVETPSASIAPWADKTAEHAKGPSLKEIQEAEARRAAEREVLLAEARRTQLEQERVAAAAAAAVAQATAPAPGLPSTSTWANSSSPGTPTTPGGSVWAKPVAAKPVSGSTAKKTLAQIQKEEEARKHKAAAQAAANAQTAAYTHASLASGNRYAQMASKATAPQAGVPSPVHAHSPSAGGGAWTTVGASGKPKTPATVVATPLVPAQRAASAAANVAPAVRPPLDPSRSASLAANAAGPKEKAKEELVKWAKAQLARGLKKDTNADDLVNTLMSFPVDLELTSDVVYQASDTLDGRRFAEEFIRRRKLADKGIAAEEGKTPAAPDTKSNNGGWNEVLKKGPVAAPKEEPAGFKVVSKKKGGKR